MSKDIKITDVYDSLLDLEDPAGAEKRWEERRQREQYERRKALKKRMGSWTLKTLWSLAVAVAAAVIGGLILHLIT